MSAQRDPRSPRIHRNPLDEPENIVQENGRPGVDVAPQRTDAASTTSAASSITGSSLDEELERSHAAGRMTVGASCSLAARQFVHSDRKGNRMEQTSATEEIVEVVEAVDDEELAEFALLIDVPD
jgi:hypothetical protein